MGNSDPLLTTLKDFGYLIVRLPRTNVRPLQILERKDNNLEKLGELKTVLKAGPNIRLPKISRNNVAGNINGRRSGGLNVNVGLTLMGNIISAMGGTSAGLEAEYRDARAVSFEFQDVLEDNVEVAELDQYLTDGQVSKFSTSVGQKLKAGKIHVTTSVIKSKKFTLEATRGDGEGLTLSVPVIRQIVGGRVGVKSENAASSKLTFRGSVPLVFGFQAVRLFFDGQGRYTAFDPVQKLAMRGAAKAGAAAPPEFLSTDGPWASLVDGSFEEEGAQP